MKHRCEQILSNEANPELKSYCVSLVAESQKGATSAYSVSKVSNTGEAFPFQIDCFKLEWHFFRCW